MKQKAKITPTAMMQTADMHGTVQRLFFDCILVDIDPSMMFVCFIIKVISY